MRTRTFLAVAGFLGIAASPLAVGSALAAEPQTETIETADGLMNIWLGAAYVDMNVTNGFGAAIDQGSFLFITQPDSGLDISSAGAEVGGDYWGSGLGLGDVYLAADFLIARDDDDIRLALPTTGARPFLDTLPLDGTPSPGLIIAGAGSQANISADADFRRTSVAAAHKLAFSPLDADIALGAYGALSRLNFGSSVRGVGGGFITLDEEVDAVSVGPMIALRKTTALTPSIEGFIEGRAAVLYAHGAFDGVQTASNLPAALNVEDERDDLAGMAEIRAGVSLLALGAGKLSLYGGLGVRNDAYEIVNPRSRTGLVASDSDSYSPGPARIEQTTQFTGSIGARFTLNF